MMADAGTERKYPIAEVFFNRIYLEFRTYTMEEIIEKSIIERTKIDYDEDSDIDIDEDYDDEGEEKEWFPKLNEAFLLLEKGYDLMKELLEVETKKKHDLSAYKELEIRKQSAKMKIVKAGDQLAS